MGKSPRELVHRFLDPSSRSSKLGGNTVILMVSSSSSSATNTKQNTKVTLKLLNTDTKGLKPPKPVDETLESCALRVRRLHTLLLLLLRW